MFKNILQLSLFFSLPAAAKSSKSLPDWALPDPTDPFSGHSEYWLSSDMLLSVSFLGWILFLWLFSKQA